MLKPIEIAAGVITILNFALALLGLSLGSADIDFLSLRPVSPSAAFFAFFILEVICSWFVCWAVVLLNHRNKHLFLIYALAMGIINVATTVFNYKILMKSSDMSVVGEPYRFLAFVFGAFIVDVVAINAIAKSVNETRHLGRLASHLDGASFHEKKDFMWMQGACYCVSALYFAFVSHAI